MLPELPDAKMDTRKLIDGPQKPVAALLSQPHKVSYYRNPQLLRLAVFVLPQQIFSIMADSNNARQWSNRASCDNFVDRG